MFSTHRAQATQYCWVGWGKLLKTELGWHGKEGQIAATRAQGVLSEDCLYPSILALHRGKLKYMRLLGPRGVLTPQYRKNNHEAVRGLSPNRVERGL